jgi:hypothetical protein
MNMGLPFVFYLPWNYIFTVVVSEPLRLLVSSARFHCVMRCSFHNLIAAMPLIFWHPCIAAICLRKTGWNMQARGLFSVWNQCCFLSCAYDLPVCSFHTTVYSMTVIDVNIFNVSTRDFQSCLVSALEVYSIVYIVLCFFFLLLTVILKAY